MSISWISFRFCRTRSCSGTLPRIWHSDLAASQPTGDTIEITFFDDILATGGTAKGLAEGLNAQTVNIDGKQYKAKVKDFVFLVEIDDLPGRAKLEGIAPVKSLIHVTEG